jgi:uncharacterized membrane protein YhaH (DUF805 family)
MKKSPKRLNRPSFWKWVISLLPGFVVLAILGVSDATRPVGGINTIVIEVSAFALVRLVLIVLLAMAIARRFRDIGWPPWIGPTILLVTALGLPFLVLGYATATYVDDFSEWGSMTGWIADSVNIVLLIIVGFVPGKPASIEVAHVFD